MIYKGIAVSSGLGVAKSLIVEEIDHSDLIKASAEKSDTDTEKKKASDALDKAASQLEDLIKRLEAKGEEHQAEVVKAQMMVLSDPLLGNNIYNKIENQSSAVEAVQSTIEEQAAVFESLEDAYFQERAQDIGDIGKRIINALLGREETDLSSLSEEVILVGHNITPSQMASINREMVKAIISETGGKTSHTAILANNMEIPAVFGINGILSELKDGMVIAVNGSKGTIEIELTPEREAELQVEIERFKKIRSVLNEMIDKPSQTKDGHVVSIGANIMIPEDVLKVNEVGADGVGLFRTEFLFMDRATLPGEEEQFQAYKRVAEALSGKPLIIRTMDIGGDKDVECLNLPKEENPFIGYRAIRICLNDKPLFKTQLRAILRASFYGKILIMYPMISSIEELRAANAILEEVKEELKSEGKGFDNDISVGIMIEVPSAGLTADILIKEADFFSIGTNDLTQYTLAVDRMNEKLSYLYNSYQPGVLRLIKSVIDAANEAEGEKFAGMCGEFAGDPNAVIMLLGMGLHEFSMNPSSLLRTRKIISMVDMDFAREVAQKALSLSTAEEVESYLKKVTEEVVGDLL